MFVAHSLNAVSSTTVLLPSVFNRQHMSNTNIGQDCAFQFHLRFSLYIAIYVYVVSIRIRNSSSWLFLRCSDRTSRTSIYISKFEQWKSVSREVNIESTCFSSWTFTLCPVVIKVNNSNEGVKTIELKNHNLKTFKFYFKERVLKCKKCIETQNLKYGKSFIYHNDMSSEINL